MKTENKPSFSINPFEIVVFLIVLALASGSFYRLFFDWNNQLQQKTDGTQTNTQAPALTKPDRSIAQQKNALYQTLDYQCSLENLNNTKKETTAERLRIIGIPCRENTRKPNQILLGSTEVLKIEVINLSNQTQATVFEESSKVKFTTDYISLVPGENKIEISHIQKNGKKITDQILITRN